MSTPEAPFAGLVDFACQFAANAYFFDGWTNLADVSQIEGLLVDGEAVLRIAVATYRRADLKGTGQRGLALIVVAGRESWVGTIPVVSLCTGAREFSWPWSNAARVQHDIRSRLDTFLSLDEGARLSVFQSLFSLQGDGLPNRGHFLGETLDSAGPVSHDENSVSLVGTAAPFEGLVDFACHFGANSYLFDGWTNVADVSKIESLVVDNEPVRCISAVTYRRADLAGAGQRGLALVVAAGRTPWEGKTPVISLRTRAGEFFWAWSEAADVKRDGRDRMAAFSSLGEAARQRLFQFLLSSPDDSLLGWNRALWLADAPDLEGALDLTCWVRPGLLLVRCWWRGATADTRGIGVSGDGYAVTVRGEVFDEFRPDLNSMWGRVLLIEIRAEHLAQIVNPRIVIITARQAYKIAGRGLRQSLSFPSNEVHSLDPALRETLSNHLIRRGMALPNSVRPEGSVAHLLDALAQDLPNCARSPDGAFEIALDRYYSAGSAFAFVCGWMVDLRNQLASLQLQAVDGQTVEVAPFLHRVPRPDIGAERAGPYYGCENHGYLATVPLPTGHFWGQNVKLTATLHSGEIYQVVKQPKTADPFETRIAVLESLPVQPYYSERIMREVLHPALTAVQRECTRYHGIQEEFVLGSPPTNPRVSIIVTLYKRLEFLRYQMAQFSLDPSLAKAEFIYVLDSPADREAFRALALEVFATYRVPFRAVILRRNIGFGPANNMGAGVAKGHLILFLNSDVFPCTPGWLDVLIESHQTRPHVGCIGAKLLFEDTSLQHAGMYFARPSSLDGLWWNKHYYKGLPSAYPPANRVRAVPAITGALMLFTRSVFAELGGWDESFLVGDFEDSDLCLRVIQRGLLNWYVPEATLWHLERQSQAPVFQNYWRQNASYYNCWLHTSRWRGLIEEVMRSAEAAVSVTDGAPCPAPSGRVR